MPYIGNSPANVGNYQIVDDISGSFNGSTTSFALASGGIAVSPAKSGQLLVGVNGVMQEPDDTGTNGFKVSGSNIVFSSAPASGDAFWSVYQGQEVDIGVPSDGVVDTIHIKDNAITTAKIAAGTIIASDVASNSITNVKMADDAVGVAELSASGTASSSTFLRGDNSWVTPTDTNTTYSVGDGGLTQINFTSADNTKLDGIEAAADVTDVTNVTAAGALMDSELAGIAAVKATTGTFLTADQTKLDTIETSATTDQTLSEINALGITATGLSGTPNVTVGTISSGNITTTGYIRGPASFTIDPATHGDDTGTLVIAGNLQVDGTTTTINSTTVSIDDLNFSIATDAANSAAANGAGITIGGAGATLNYTHATTSWDMNKPLNVTGNIGVSGTVDGVDIAARDAILTSTTTTAGAALPKAGGTMTGNLTVTRGSGNAVTRFQGASNSQSSKLFVSHISSGDGGLYYNSNYMDIFSYSDIRFNVGTANASGSIGDQRMVIKNNGNVGIGIGSPTAKLHLYEETSNTTTASNVMRIQSQSSGTTGVGFGGAIYFLGERADGTLQGMAKISAVADVNTTSNLSSALTFQTASSGTNTERLRIDSSGKISVGNNLPIWSGSYGGALFLKGNNATSARHAELTIVDSNGATIGTGLVVDNNRNVGIGTSSPDQLLHVWKATAGSITASSDAQLVVENSAIAAINLLSGANSHGQILFGDSGDADDGQFGYDQSNREFYFKTAGNSTKRLLIDSSGNVGIGTDSPTGDGTALHIHGSSYSYLHLTNSTTGSAITDGFDIVTDGSDVKLRNRESAAMIFATAGTERLRIDSSGNALFNTTDTNPANDSSGTGVAIGAGGWVAAARDGDTAGMFNRLTSDGNIVSFHKDGTTVGSIGSNSSGGVPVLDINTNTSSGIMRFLTSGTERLRIDASGKVGIGTTSPATALHIASASAPEFRIEDTTNSTKAFIRPLDTLVRFGTDSNHPLAIYTNSTEAMRIDSSGNVVIGTTSTDGRLKISATSGNSEVGSITLYGNNSGGYGGSNVVKSKIESKTDGGAYGANMLFYTNDTSNAYQERMRIDSSGNITQKGGDYIYDAGGNFDIKHTTASQNITFHTTPSGGSATERLRITSSGNVGIGVTDPDSRLEVKSAGGGSEYAFKVTDASSNDVFIVTGGGKAWFNYGPVGIGVTPESWHSSYTALQIGGMGCLSSYGTATVTADTKLTQNAYRATSGTWQRIYTDYTSEYQQISGKHVFKVAPSGSADAAISWKTALTIDNGGDTIFYNSSGTEKMRWDASTSRLGIGTDTPAAGLEIKQASDDQNNGLRITRSSENTYGSLFIAGGGEGQSDPIILQHSNGTRNLMAWGRDGEVIIPNGNLGIGNTTPSTALDVTGTITADANILAAYSDTTAITDNAVDIFIYDTSKDSDGGAWRKRTQHTSWYNEASSSTRGSRKEFPAVAVIVVDNANQKITIYDGDTPDLDMWMIFNIHGSSWLDYDNAGTTYNLAALNGQLCIAKSYSGGSTATYSGLGIVNFLEDSLTKVSNSTDGTGIGKSTENIANRNDSFRKIASINSYALVNYACNDVAMTVLPNAPIDSATGLPIPTIAVATDGGVSVIKDDGSVVNITYSDTYNGVKDIKFDSDNNVCFTAQQSGGVTNYYNYNVYAIPSSTPSMTDYRTNALRAYETVVTSATHYSDVVLNPALYGTANANITAVETTDYGLVAGFGDRLSSILETDHLDEDTNAVAYITSDYNTGYMTGDIKGAWLSDTDTTNAGAELATNPDFTSNTSGWGGDSGATLTWVSGGTVTVGNGGGDNTWAIKQTSILTSGKQYAIKFKFRPNNTGLMRIRAGGSSVQWSTTSFSVNNWNEVEVVVQADSSTLEIGNSGGNMTSFDIDYINVSLADQDRSVNANGLAVHGTITKTAVATGADLVAYSGFSTSNYLEQPYNSDLDFGTGDFSYSLWIYRDSLPDSTHERWFGTATSTGTKRVDIFSNGGTDNIAFYLVDGSSTLGDIRITGIGIGVWHSFVFTRVGNAYSIYHNGKFAAVHNGSSINLTADTDRVTHIGEANHWDAGHICNGKVALAKISGTAPSAEQIKDIYEAEKVLFYENAKCTLNGSSDSVTALDYDDSNDELLVGTSGGLSVFKGLRRVDENTNSITEVAQQGGLRVEEY